MPIPGTWVQQKSIPQATEKFCHQSKDIISVLETTEACTLSPRYAGSNPRVRADQDVDFCLINLARVIPTGHDKLSVPFKQYLLVQEIQYDRGSNIRHGSTQSSSLKCNIST